MKLILVGIKQGLQACLIPYQALFLAQQVLLIAQQAHCTALCQPHQRAQDIMLSEAPLKSQGNHKRPKLTTSNTKPLLLIAVKQRKLKDWKYSPEDHQDLPIWLTYLEGVEE